MEGKVRREGEAGELSHVRSGGAGSESRMVDVSGKAPTAREAIAEARVRFPAGVLPRLLVEGGAKGPITEVARVAGILAAKRTGELIPMCHPLGLDLVEVLFEPDPKDPDVLEIRCRAACFARTGVEMEAMCGASVAALAVYDMAKAVSKGIVVERVRLLAKKGGKTGLWEAGPGVL